MMSGCFVLVVVVFLNMAVAVDIHVCMKMPSRPRGFSDWEGVDEKMS